MPISLAPTARLPAPRERMAEYLSRPLSLPENITEQITQSLVGGGYGIGTLVRDIAIPRGNTGPHQIVPSAVPMFGPIAQGLDQAIQLGNQVFRRQQPSLSKEQYQASPYYREAVPFQEGMTEDRAAALAWFWDQQAVRQHFFDQMGPWYHPANLLPSVVGAALDPINFIPVVGPGLRAALVARAGGVIGHGIASMADAALNTAVFGLATAKERRNFGDDTSWTAMGIEIAASALFGSVFGAGIGLYARPNATTRVAQQRLRAKLDTAANLTEAAVPMNHAIDDVAAGRDVDLPPMATAPVERIRQEVTDRLAGQRELFATSEAVTGTRPGEVAISPSGHRIAVRPEVVDLSTLQPATGATQVRNRTTPASAAQVDDIAINLDPGRLMPATAADQGAPIVGPDNVIDSGNGRVMGIARAAQAYPERYQAYRQALVDAGYQIPEGVQTPVLISRRVTDLSPDARAQFNADANASSTARMSAVELAQMDRAALMSGSVMDVLADGPVTGAANRSFVSRFLNELPQNERGALVAEDGISLSADGARRVENALVAAAYGDIDPSVIRRFAEATDDNTRAIVGAMSDAAGKWALMRRAVKMGDIAPELDTTPELTHALRLVSEWREQARQEGRAVSTVIREGMAQIDLLAGELGPEVKFIVRSFYQNDHFAVAVGRDTIAAQLGRVADAAFDLGRPQLFGEATAVSKGEMLKNAVGIESDLFAPEDLGPGAQGRGQGDLNPETGTNRRRDRAGAEDQQATNPSEPSLVPLPINATRARPDQHPDGLVAAASRVGKPEPMRDLAAQNGVELASGDFPERVDVEQLREEGLLTATDEAELAAAAEAFGSAEAYANTLKAALSCILQG